MSARILDSWSRRGLLASAGGAVACGFWPKDIRTRSTESAARWLMEHQGPDGSFAQDLLLTARAALALGRLPAVSPRVVERALSYLADAAPGSDTPIAARSLAAIALGHLRPLGWERVVRQLAEELQAQQLTGDRWTTEIDRGGFPRVRGQAEPKADLTVTRFALQALTAAGVPPDAPPLREARRYVLGCSCPDGGFRQSRSEPDRNHGARNDSGFGTPTCDGVLALRELGLAEERRLAALVWLRSRFRVDETPGVGLVRWRRWARGTRFQWRALVTSVFVVDGGPSRWGDVISTALIDEQRPDGSWANEETVAGEHDPLLATAYGLYVMARAPRHR